MSLTPARRGLVLLTVLLLTAPGVAAGPTAEEIARAIKQLGDDDFAVRQKASQFLWEAGPAVEPALREAVKGDDAEIVLRAAALLDKFRWGIYHDTPAEVVDLIKAYRAANDNAGREKALKGLLAGGSKGLAALRKIATAETNPEAQNAVKGLLNREAAAAVPALLAEEKYDELEELLAFAAATRQRRPLQDYVACVMLRDRVDVKITQLGPSAGDPAAAQTLAYLHRAKGDLAQALAYASKAGDNDLVETLLYLRRDWAGLRELLAPRQAGADEGALGLLLTCQLRTGQKDEAARTVAALKELAENKPVGDGSAWWSSKPLFLNGLTEDALGVLPRGRHYAMMFDVWAVRLRCQEMMELAEQLRAKQEKGWLGAAVRHVRLLRTLGELKKADALLDELAGASGKPAEDWERRELIALLTEAGRPGPALEALGERLTKNPQAPLDPWLWSAVFPRERGRQAVAWWTFLRARDTDRSVADTVKAVREIMDGREEPKRLSETLAEALRWAGTLPADRREAPLQALAEWCADRKLRERERECLQAAAEAKDSDAAWQRLGEHDAAGQKWREAAASFRRAWEKDRTQPAPLWLWGWALDQAGDAKEGARLMERARWLPLGNDVKRYALARVLGQHGRPADEHRELAMNQRLALLDSWYLGNALYGEAVAAAERQDYLPAADALDLSVLRVMSRGTFFLDERAWVVQPARVHDYRGRGLLAAGKVEEALREADARLKLLPGDVNVAIEFVPALEKLGSTREADALFEKSASLYEGLLRDYPDWAGGGNDLAWLCVRCRRRLDEALKLAEKAVERE